MEKKKTDKAAVMGRDVAIVELNKWYDFLEVPEDLRLDIDLNEELEEGETKKKEKDDAMRERVIRGIMSGSIILSEENQLVYTLKEPIKNQVSGDITYSELTFKNRYKAHQLEANMKGVKPEDFLPMTRAYIATLTGVSRSILGQLWNKDMAMAQAVYTLFSRGEA